MNRANLSTPQQHTRLSTGRVAAFFQSLRVFRPTACLVRVRGHDFCLECGPVLRIGYIKALAILALVGGSVAWAETKRAFPLLRPGQELSWSEVHRALRSKFEMRALGQGGPIRQPRFGAIRAEATDTHRLASQTEDFSPRLHWTGTSGVAVLGIDAFAQSLATGQGLPVVYKPNASAFGAGIVFIERSGDQLVLQTKREATATGSSAALQKALDAHDVSYTARRESPMIAFAITDSTNVSRAFKEAWRSWSHVNPVRYDTGMFESMVNHVGAPDGRAFEVRRQLVGDMRSGAVQLVKSHDDLERLLDGGGSNYGARLGDGRFVVGGRSELLPFEQMYQPLYEIFGMGSERQAQFEAHIDNLVERQFAHYAKRLRESGLVFEGQTQAQMDLFWLRPEQAGGFPVPVIAEAFVAPPSTQGAPIIVQDY